MSKAQYREDPAVQLQDEKKKSPLTISFDTNTVMCKVCGHHRTSREHKAQKDRCSKIMQKRRLGL